MPPNCASKSNLLYTLVVFFSNLQLFAQIIATFSYLSVKIKRDKDNIITSYYMFANSIDFVPESRGNVFLEQEKQINVCFAQMLRVSNV